MTVMDKVSAAVSTAPFENWNDLVKRRLESVLGVVDSVPNLWMRWFAANGLQGVTLQERAAAYWNSTNAPQEERNIFLLGWSVFYKLYIPQPPTAPVATAGTGQASVAFVPPTNTGNTPIIDYEVLSNPGGITATGTASPIVVPGLTAATDYTFTVRARNSVGFSAPSVASNSVTIL